MKNLSVVIPTYNMEKYLNRCLDSFLLSDEHMAKLEVIVVNDGSTDSSSQIAHEYQVKYPHTFVVIDKANGHYGSCVNFGLKVASGKYFRIVDADDWVNSNNLAILIDKLDTRDEDIIFTKHTLQYVFKNQSIDQSVSGIIWNKSLDLNSFNVPECCCAMHSITIKTDFLKCIDYVQTEGICYTDTEYIYYPLCQAQSLFCIDISVYQYFIGREDQTMAKSSVSKNFNHFITLLRNIQKFESTHNHVNKNFTWIHNRYYSLLFHYLFLITVVYNKEDKEKYVLLRDIFKEITIDNTTLVKKILNRKIYGVKLIKHWYSNDLIFKFAKLLLNVYRSR